MKQRTRIIIVRHHDDDLDDTASTHLADSNYQIENWFPFQQPTSTWSPALTDVAGTIVMGGAQNVTEMESLPYLQLETAWILQCIANDLPVVGICLGSQLLANALGADVGMHKDGHCEFGYETIHPTEGNEWVPTSMHVTQAHFQGFCLPPESTLLATGDQFPVQAFLHKHNVFGFQFHPEVHSAMFESWMKSSWADAFYATPGCQTPELQASHNEQHNARQTAWFKTFLGKVFPPLITAKR